MDNNKSHGDSSYSKRDSSENKNHFKSKSYNRKKVCPFIMDKKLVLDYKNIKLIQRFITETGKIVPRYISGVSAKKQRELSKHIKRARNLGIIAPLTQDLTKN